MEAAGGQSRDALSHVWEEEEEGLEVVKAEERGHGNQGKRVFYTLVIQSRCGSVPRGWLHRYRLLRSVGRMGAGLTWCLCRAVVRTCSWVWEECPHATMLFWALCSEKVETLHLFLVKDLDLVGLVLPGNCLLSLCAYRFTPTKVVVPCYVKVKICSPPY